MDMSLCIIRGDVSYHGFNFPTLEEVLDKLKSKYMPKSSRINCS
jgi:hypothetical protein